MTSILDRLRKPKTDSPPEQPAPAEAPPPQPIVQLHVDSAPNDPLLAFLLSATGAVDISLQWSKAKNVWHNAVIRTTVTAPARAVKRLVGSDKRVAS